MKVYMITIICLLLMITLCSCGAQIFQSEITEGTLVNESDLVTEAQTFRPVEYVLYNDSVYQENQIGEAVVNEEPYFEAVLTACQDNLIYIDQGDTADEFICFFACEANDFSYFGYQNYKAEVTILEEGIVEVTDIDMEKLYDDNMNGGLDIHALSPGIAHLYLKFTHIPTGGSRTFQIIVIVREPATQPVEATT